MMISNDKTLSHLLMMQHCDSFFPSGSVSFSWGLEPLVNLKLVTNAEETNTFLNCHLHNRWATFDLPILHYFATERSIDEIIKIDHLIEAQSLPKEQRIGSKKLGAAIIAIHKKLNTSGAARLSKEISQKNTFGHLSVVQGYLWQKLGFNPYQIKLMSVHTLCTGILSSAVRLSVIGFLDAQNIYTNIQIKIKTIIDCPTLTPNKMHSFLPLIDIASMKHETDETRMFMN